MGHSIHGKSIIIEKALPQAWFITIQVTDLEWKLAECTSQIARRNGCIKRNDNRTSRCITQII